MRETEEEIVHIQMHTMNTYRNTFVQIFVRSGQDKACLQLLMVSIDPYKIRSAKATF